MNTSYPTNKLIEWFKEEHRDLPWRGKTTAYETWVAEIMLQQTQVSTVKDYYEPFLERFPDVRALEDASQDEVLKAWEGMGYYARARRLHRAAKTIVSEFDGDLPRKKETLMQLSGIGDYTAAAIEAFAFGGDSPVMDSNVKRVMARWAGIETPLSRADTEARIRDTLQKALERASEPGQFSEGVMELGALICVPHDPHCEECPLQGTCDAYRTDRIGSLPVTQESPEKPHHEVVVAVIKDGNSFLISRRPEDKMLGGLWEFPGGKLEADESLREALKREMLEELGIEVSVNGKIRTVPHEYSHLSINLHAYNCNILNGKPSAREDQTWRWVPLNELSQYAFPKANKTILETILSRNKEEFSST